MVRGVVIRGSNAEEVFYHSAAHGEDLPLQLITLRYALETRMADLKVACAVVRRDDFNRNARLTDITAMRLRGEGVLLATAREKVDQVKCLNGLEISQLCGISSEVIEARAEAMLSKAAARATEAAMAAEELLQQDGSHG